MLKTIFIANYIDKIEREKISNKKIPKNPIKSRKNSTKEIKNPPKKPDGLFFSFISFWNLVVLLLAGPVLGVVDLVEGALSQPRLSFSHHTAKILLTY